MFTGLFFIQIAYKYARTSERTFRHYKLQRLVTKGQLSIVAERNVELEWHLLLRHYAAAHCHVGKDKGNRCQVASYGMKLKGKYFWFGFL